MQGSKIYENSGKGKKGKTNTLLLITTTDQKTGEIKKSEVYHCSLNIPCMSA